MAKGFAIFGMVVAIIFLLVFGLDIAIAVPFGNRSTLADVFFIVASLCLAVMSWMTFRENS
jgi:hypothetical protein